MSDTTVHVFVGSFPDRRAATAYTGDRRGGGPDAPPSGRPDPGAEPGRSSLRDDLRSARLDPRYVQTIHGPERWDYLAGLLVDEDAIDRIRAMTGSNDNVLVLVLEEAFRGEAVALRSTPVLTYCGAWPAIY